MWWFIDDNDMMIRSSLEAANIATILLLGFMAILSLKGFRIPVPLIFISSSWGLYELAVEILIFCQDISVKLLFVATIFMVGPLTSLMCILIFFRFLWQKKLGWGLNILGILPCCVLAWYHINHIPQFIDFLCHVIKLC